MTMKDSRGKEIAPLVLFIIFFKIGALTWGGGYGMVPMIKRVIVDRRNLLTPDEFLDGLSVAQSLPGVLAVNTACYVGRSLSGLTGTLAACLGAVLPSFFIMMGVAAFFVRFQEAALVTGFFRGAIPAVTALIAHAVLDIGRSAIKEPFDAGIAALLFLLILLFGLHPLWVVVLGGLIGLARGWRRA